MFNPISSPNMGEAWKGMIRTIKEARFTVIESISLTDFQMLALLSEIEILVNNRPLTY